MVPSWPASARVVERREMQARMWSIASLNSPEGFDEREGREDIWDWIAA